MPNTFATERRWRLVFLGAVVLAVVFSIWRLTHRQQTYTAALSVQYVSPWTKQTHLSGYVVDTRGHPVPDVTIFLVGRKEGMPQSHLVTKVHSDTEGRFHIANVDRLLAEWPLIPSLLAQAPDFGISCLNLTAVDQPVEILLRPATRLQVRIEDGNGKPVPKVRIGITGFLMRNPSAHLAIPSELHSTFTKYTDSNGNGYFSQLPQETEALVEIDDVRFAQLTGAQHQVPLSRTRHSWVTILLTPGARISGRVTYRSTDKPAVGIRVGAQGTNPSGAWGEAVTDREGRYTISQLPRGSYHVALDLRGEMAKSLTAVAWQGVNVSEGAHLAGVDFSLLSGSVIQGKAFVKATGQPITGVLVAVYGPAHPRSGAWVQNTRTGSDGSYQLCVPPGRQYLYLQAEEAPPGLSLPKASSFDIVTSKGETVTYDFPYRGYPSRNE